MPGGLGSAAGLVDPMDKIAGKKRNTGLSRTFRGFQKLSHFVSHASITSADSPLRTDPTAVHCSLVKLAELNRILC
jgi:hypothetical protein